MTAEAVAPLAYVPAVPYEIDDLGIPKPFVLDLALRRIAIEGTSSLTSLSRTLRLSIPVVQQLFRELRQQQLLDMKGSIGEDFSFSLTNTGKQTVNDRRDHTQYAGPAPVSLAQYYQAVRAQKPKLRLNREDVRRAFSDLVIPDRFIEQLGPALISQQSIFLYGPTGNGKTSLAERMLRIYQDRIIVPYAVEVDNQVITLYDPTVHQAIAEQPDDMDPRWVVCHRPSVIAGGELTASMLELQFDDAPKAYAAPLQMKANNGILIIDDFGRQVMSPRELLNRWIFPLDRRLDFLTLRYGLKVQIPFELMVVFATNLNPLDLADEAFLRRIPNKIHLESVDAETFDEIVRRVAAATRIECDPPTIAFVREVCKRFGSGELRACYPRDLFHILEWISMFDDRPPEASAHNLERASLIYFTKTQPVLS